MQKKNKEERQQKTCFVIGPIGSVGSEVRNHADILLEYIIKPALVSDTLGYSVKRADDEKSPLNITVHVINSTLDADLVVADLTDHNANAFYELGLRHMIEKPVIHMIKSGEKPPFDVSTFNTIFYHLDNPESHREAANTLQEHANSIQQKEFHVSNPVTAARGHQQLKQSADPLQQTVSALAKDMANIKQMMNRHNWRNFQPPPPSDIVSRGNESGLPPYVLHKIIASFKDGNTMAEIGHFLRSVVGRKLTNKEINQYLNYNNRDIGLTIGDIETIFNIANNEE